ncbi:MAG: glutamate--cysteine ligase, partial [Pseudomonadota bacterium]
VEISHAGLKARARPGAGGLIPDETHFLDALRDTLERGETPAEELLGRWDGEWKRDFAKLYEAEAY